MSFEQAWSGDWRERILARVRQRGFETITQYMRARPGISLIKLADELGTDDVAGAQIRAMYVAEAVRSRTIPRILRDLFVRELRARLPDGWRRPLDDAARSEVAGVLGHWETELQEHLDAGRTYRAGQELLSAELPDGWLPGGPDDPVIVAFVDRCLGAAPA